MIKKMLNILGVSVLVLTGLMATASAQDTSSTKTVKIDFDFYAGKKLMPAGEYRISLRSNTSTHKMILIKQVNGDEQAILASVPYPNKTNYEPGSLVFNRYGEQYFFSAVQLGNGNALHTILKTRAEREIGKKIAKNSNNDKQEEVVTISSVQ